jgi:hypothetical protein
LKSYLFEQYSYWLFSGGDQGPTCKVKGFGGDLKEKIYTSILKGISQANVACQNLARNQQ